MAVSTENKEKAKKYTVLVVCKDTAISHQLRGTLLELGVQSVAAEYKHGSGLKRLDDKKYTHIFFDSTETDMTPAAFVEAVRAADTNAGLIALADKLNVNDVFELLRIGARSFLLFPFTFEAVENSLKHIEQEYEIREDLIQGGIDLGSTLTEVVLTNFNMLCRLMSLRGEEGKGTPELESLIKERKQVLMDSIDLARANNLDSVAGFREKIMEICLNHAMETGSRLSRVRKKLKKQRQSGQELTSKSAT